MLSMLYKTVYFFKGFSIKKLGFLNYSLFSIKEIELLKLSKSDKIPLFLSFLLF
jgi:hypothetical protein